MKRLPTVSLIGKIVTALGAAVVLQVALGVVLFVQGAPLLNLILCSLPLIPLLVLLVYCQTRLQRRLHFLSESLTRVTSGLALVVPSERGDEELESIFSKIVALNSTITDARLMAKSNQSEGLERLQDAEERIRTLLTGMPIGLIVATQDGVVESVNSRFMEMFRVKASDLPGKDLRQVLSFPCEVPGESLSQLLARLGDGSVLEIDAQRSDGTSLPVEVSGCPLSLPDGERWLLSLYDISERREMERMRQEIFSMITHDLRTPLATIKNFLEMLAGALLGELNQQGKRMLVLAERNSDRMLMLISDLLDVERAKAQLLQLETSDVALDEVISSAVEPLEPWAQERGITLNFESSDLLVNADQDRLIRVITNLISNAVKFSPSGTSVSISAQRDGRFARIDVQDQGRGIPSDKIKSIFDRFSQVKTSDASLKEGGSGLGLAICKAFVELHGGTISVSSQPEKGTTFSFTIPLAAGG